MIRHGGFNGKIWENRGRYTKPTGCSAAPLLLGTKHAAIGGQFVPAERRCWVGWSVKVFLVSDVPEQRKEFRCKVVPPR